jgi:phosphonate transport system substrate-binding protein
MKQNIEDILKRKWVFVPGIVLMGLVLMLLTIFFYHRVLDIRQPFPELAEQPTTVTGSDKPVVYFGVISRYPPTLIYQGYQPLMDYLTEQTPYRFELKLSSSYQQTVEQLASGEVAAAFLGSYIYVLTRRRYGLQAILKPLNENFEPYFHSVLITRTDSPIYRVPDLKHKKLALPSRQSFSGNWLLRFELSRFGLTPADLDSIHYFSHHHTVIYQVLKGNFDAGVVKDRVAREYLNRGIRICAYSSPVPGSPIVISRKSPPRVVAAIRQALLKVDVHQEPYRQLVSRWDREFAYGFVEASDSDYDSILQIIGSDKGR